MNDCEMNYCKGILSLTKVRCDHVWIVIVFFDRVQLGICNITFRKDLTLTYIEKAQLYQYIETYKQNYEKFQQEAAYFADQKKQLEEYKVKLEQKAAFLGQKAEEIERWQVFNLLQWYITTIGVSAV